MSTLFDIIEWKIIIILYILFISCAISKYSTLKLDQVAQGYAFDKSCICKTVSLSIYG